MQTQLELSKHILSNATGFSLQKEAEKNCTVTKEPIKMFSFPHLCWQITKYINNMKTKE